MSCNCCDGNSPLDTPYNRGRDGLPGAAGKDGWTPMFAIEVRDSDGAQVRKVVGYFGGTGAAPTDYIGYYESESGLVEDIESATKINGYDGATGAAGKNGYLALATWEKDGDTYYAKITVQQEITGVPDLLGKYVLPNGTPTETKAAALKFTVPNPQVSITTAVLLAAIPTGAIWPTSAAILANFSFETGLGSGDWAGWALLDGRNGTDGDARKRVIGGLDYNTPTETTGGRVVDEDFDTPGKQSGEKTHLVQPGEIPQKQHTHGVASASGLNGAEVLFEEINPALPGGTATRSDLVLRQTVTTNPAGFAKYSQARSFTGGSTQQNSSGAASTQLSLQQLTIAFPYIQKI